MLDMSMVVCYNKPMPNTRQHRKFGIEIECFGVREVPRILTERNWIIGYDGSIRGNNAYEFKSPPLPATAASFKEVKEVMKAIREAGGQVNRSCGMHVHVGVENDVRRDCIPGLFFYNLIDRYNKIEGFTDMLVPPSRRGDNNHNCLSTERLINTLTRTSLEALRGVTNHDAVQDYVYCISRGYKINTTAYLRHGTIEFRHHAGSLNGDKAVAWIKFCLAFINTCSKASLRNESERKNYTEEQWNNPYLGIVSRRLQNRLRRRYDAAIAA